jgi:signal peptide peptidase SppA
MRLDLWYGRPWALLPAKMDEIQGAVDALAAGARLEGFAAGKSGHRADDSLVVHDGVAVIPVYGTLDSKANLIGDASGGTSYQLLARDIRAAAADRSVDALLLDIDSPGGSTDGVFEAVAAVREARAKKPVVAYTGGHMTSAAYWIGSAASRVVVSPQSMVGSIGVRMVHTDRSESDARAGVKRTEIYAGQYKSAGTDSAPLDADSKAYLQAMADKLHTVFVESVAAQRAGARLTVADVLAKGARVYVGAEAVKEKLADKVGDMTLARKTARKEIRMNREQLKAEHPELYQAVLQEGAASVVVPDVGAAAAAARAEGVAAERTRAVKLVSAHGPLDLTLAALQEGAEPGDFALSVLQAEREGRAAGLDRLAASLAPAVPSAPAARPEAAGDVVDFMAAARARAQEKGLGLAEAVRQVTAESPDLREAYAHDACRKASRKSE